MNYEAVAQYSQVASAVLFVAAMVWIWIKFIQPAVVAAQENANAQLAQAERRRDEAKAALGGLQGEIANAQRDAAAIKDRVEAQAHSERDAIVREAREAGERALHNAAGELARARAAARQFLRDELLDKALDLARSQAGARVDPAMNERLVGSFLSSLERDGTRVIQDVRA